MVGSNNCGGKEIIQPNDDVMWLKNLTYDVINTAFTQKYGTLGTDDVVDKMSKVKKCLFVVLVCYFKNSTHGNKKCYIRIYVRFTF